MPAYQSTRKEITTSLAMGFVAYLINFLSEVLVPGAMAIQPGNIMIFLAASAFGPSGALMASAAGVLPETFVNGAHLYALRIITLSVAIGYASRKWPKTPGYLVATACWVFVYAPLMILAQSPLIKSFPVTLSFQAHTEILLVLVAGALLLNDTVWAKLKDHPRVPSATTLFMHVLTLIAVTILYCSEIVVLNAPSLGSATVLAALPWLMPALLLFSIVLPSLVGWRIALLLQNNLGEYFPSHLLPQTRGKTFSGLASDYWRRRRANKSEEAVTGSATKEFISKHTNEPFDADKGIIALNRDGTVTFVNKVFRFISGLHREDIIGKHVASCGLDPQITKHILDLMEITFNKGPRTIEVKLNQLPDPLRYLEFTSLKPGASGIASLEDGPQSVIITVRDITERRAVESHLLQGQKLSSLGNFVRGMAHAVNNALTAITGQASYAIHSSDNKQREKALRQILKASHNAAKTVRKLLDFADGQPTQRKEHNPAQLIEDRLDLLKSVAGEDYEIVYCKQNDATAVSCDPNLLMQALTNLILNARESYNGKNGKIYLNLDTEDIPEEVAELHAGVRPGFYVRVRVRDEGIGMSAEQLQHAFDPLYTTKGSRGHAGLGLSIVFAIMRAHDGFLTTESNLDKGTTVSLYFPARQLQPGETLEHQSTIINSNSSSAKQQEFQESILVVEDEPQVRESVATMLSALGYDVTSCSSGHEALKHCQQRKFDLVLVDMMMPQMNGCEVIERIREIHSNMRTLIMTGYGTATVRNGGRIPVLPKPFDIETLSVRIREALEAS
ncbi:MAG: PAS domain-containing hybrid sensor histidine kinase/response regulator [Candidatus Dadabacteria bacterium]|nr:MAG: PAS domain-containing hybrid sensor histidine kinase/response regulator [Candidatus Dadabacteria bacterium]